jgi:hypothetical protein
MRWRAHHAEAAYADGTRKVQIGPSAKDAEIVSVVADHPVGSFNRVLADQAVRLAQAAGAAALDVAFDTASDPPQFIWADPWVDVSNPSIANALLESLVDQDRLL